MKYMAYNWHNNTINAQATMTKQLTCYVSSHIAHSMYFMLFFKKISIEITFSRPTLIGKPIIKETLTKVDILDLHTNLELNLGIEEECN